MNGKTKRYTDLIDGVLELANKGLSSEDYAALLDELKRELVFPRQCPMAAPEAPCTYAYRHHGPHSWEKQEAVRARSLRYCDAQKECQPRPATETRCASLSCKNPPVASTPLCIVHEGDVKNAPAPSPRQALGEALECVQRASSLVSEAKLRLSGSSESSRAEGAHDDLRSAHSWLRRLYEGADA